MKKLLLFTSVVFLIIGGCSKSELLEEKLPNTGEHTVAAARDGKYDVLGYGYDVTTEYARGSLTKQRVLNIEKLATDYPSRVQKNPSSEQFWSSEFGSNAEDITRKISAKVEVGASVPLFSATLKASTSDSNAFSSKYIYGTSSLVVQQQRINFNASTALMTSQYLDPAFKADIQTMSPQQLVAIYGTHVMSDIRLGGTLELTYQSETSNSSRSSAAEVGIDVGVKIFKLNGQVNTESTTNASNFNQKLFYRTRGGDGSKGLIGDIPIDGSGVSSVNITSWQNSITVSNSDLIDFGYNGLIPIYEFIANTTKKNAVKTYISQYLSDRNVTLTPDIVPLISFWNAPVRDHWYVVTSSTSDYGNWDYEGPVFKVLSSPYQNAVPVYQYWNAKDNDHLYTTGSSSTTGGGLWKREYIAFYAFNYQYPGTVPVYQYWNAKDRDHLYTTGSSPTTGGGLWKRESIVFYVFP